MEKDNSIEIMKKQDALLADKVEIEQIAKKVQMSYNGLDASQRQELKQRILDAIATYEAEMRWEKRQASK